MTETLGNFAGLRERVVGKLWVSHVRRGRREGLEKVDAMTLKERALLTSTCTLRLLVLQRRRTVAEVPYLERPKNQDCLCSQTGPEH